VAFQVGLILSGNLSFLNWLTIVPILACFDDGLLRRMLPRPLVAMSERAAATVRDVWRSFEFNVQPGLALEGLFVRLRRELGGTLSP